MEPNSEKKPTILIVEDIIELRNMFVWETRKCFPDYEIIGVDTLEKARDVVRSIPLKAIITDCGFPENDQTPREHGNTCGLKLIQEIREGALGEKNRSVIIAFNSAEMDEDKEKRALKFGGQTSCFKKGSIYPTIAGRNASEHTVSNVTARTLVWLQQEFEKEEKSLAVPEIATSSTEPPSRLDRILSRLGLRGKAGGVSRT